MRATKNKKVEYKSNKRVRMTEAAVCTSIIIIVLTLCWVISTYLYQLMLIQGDSMLPTYHNLQLVLLNKHNSGYEVGDVVAFKCPELNSVLVKRIVAQGNDFVCTIDGRLKVNGEDSPLYEMQVFDYEGILSDGVLLSTGEYIMIGDNIQESRDSRDPIIGVIKSENIIGKIVE